MFEYTMEVMTEVMAKAINGKEVALRVRGELKAECERLKDEKSLTPGLAVVLVGEDHASRVYVRNKTRACEEVGISSFQHILSREVKQEKLLELVSGLNVNVGRLVTGRPLFEPCTPRGIMELLDSAAIEISGKDAVVVGRSNIVGKPTAFMLLHRHATVTICHSRTTDLPAKVNSADIVIAAVGRAGFVKGEWIREGAVVVDVGMNRTPEGGLVGDVEFEGASKRASYITPVPGGVGPMTVAMLLKNTVEAAKRSCL
jgi:methylenetetrahydrofolate dehydrogenase (NADP+)/methenyltetrahydrofolate cyclohydrolase